MAVETPLAEGDGFYLYKEYCNENQICLKLCGDVDFEASRLSVVVKIPTVIWEVIRQIPAAQFDLVSKTDEELAEIVEKEVDEKIARSEHIKRKKLGTGKVGCCKSFTIAASLPYAIEGLSRTKQLQRGINYYLQKRADQQSTLKKIQECWVAETLSASK